MKNTKWLLILAFTAVLIYFLQVWLTWFNADDFCFIPLVKGEGIFGSMLTSYLNWDGRSISLTYPISRLGLFFGKPWIAPCIGSVLMILNAMLILSIAGFRFQKIQSKFIAVISLTTFMWLGSFNFISQTLYWASGIGYNMDIFLLLLAVWIYQNFKPKVGYIIAAIFVYFYAGTVSPNGVLGILIVLTFEWIYNSILKNETNKIKYIFPLGLILLGFVVVILAPGNANRLGTMDKANFTHIWTIYFNIKLMLSHLWKFNTPILWMAITLGILGAWNQLKNSSVNGSRLQRCIEIAFEFRWLLAAFVAFIFFLIHPDLHSPRTNIHFFVFATVFVVMQVHNLLIAQSWLSKNLLILGSYAVLFLFVVIGGTQAFDARFVRAQMVTRNEKLTKLKGSHVVLGVEDLIRTSTTRRFEDASSDTAYWLNRCMAEYYGLKSIRMEFKKDSVIYAFPDPL